MGWLSKKWKQIKGWFTPSEPKPQGVNIEKKGTNQGVPIIYGFVKKSPCIKVLKVTTDKSGGAVNEYLHFICVFAVGEIEEIGQLYFNDIPQSQIDSERYFIKKFLGSETQTYCTELAAEFSRWKTTAKLENVAYAYVRLTQNKKVDWWRGEPSVAADIKGLKVLDPRDGLVKYSENPALCTYDYLTNDDYGKGLAVSKMNTASFITAANFIETSRTYTRTIYKTEYLPQFGTWVRIEQGTVNETVIENLMSCNVSLDPEKTIKKNVETLLGGMRAILPETNGEYRVAIEKDDAPVFAFTKDNIAGAIQCQGGSQSDRYNQVIIRFRNKLTGEDDEAVFPDDDALHQQWRIEDGGVPGGRDKLLLGEFDFDTINNRAEALQMGHVIAHRSRNLLGAMFSGFPETIVVEAGDIITLDSNIFGWNAKPFRIESVDIDVMKSGEVAFQAVEHQNTIYPWAIADVIEEYADTSFALPQSIEVPTGLAFSAIINDNLKQGKLTWADANNALVSFYVVETYENVLGLVNTQPSTDNFIDVFGLPSGNYTFKVYAANALHQSLSTEINLNISQTSIGWSTVVGFDFEDNRINNAIAEQNAKDYVDTNFVNSITHGQNLDDLQAQIDGNITTWFKTGAPTLANAPANTWTTTTLKNQHLGDLYYDDTTGYAYRFKLVSTVYSWQLISDSDVTKALQDAANAQSAADGKIRLFVVTPYSPYDTGDLWDTGAGLKRSGINRTSGFSNSDWLLVADQAGAAQQAEDNANANTAEQLEVLAASQNSLFANGSFSVLASDGRPMGCYAAYDSGTKSNVSWDATEQALKLYSLVGDLKIGMGTKPFAVDPNTRYKIRVSYKSNVNSASGFYIRVPEYDGTVGKSTKAISSGSDFEFGVIAGSRVITNLKENESISTSWVIEEFIYTPTATAEFASLQFHNNTGMGSSALYLQYLDITPMSGALNLKDSIDKTDVGLTNVDNKSGATIRNEITEANVVGSGKAFTVKPNKFLPIISSFFGRISYQLDNGSTVDYEAVSQTQVDTRVTTVRPESDYKNTNTTKTHVGLTNVPNYSAETMRAGVTKTHVGVTDSQIDTRANNRVSALRPDSSYKNTNTTKTNVGLANVDNTSDATQLQNTQTTFSLDDSFSNALLKGLHLWGSSKPFSTKPNKFTPVVSSTLGRMSYKLDDGTTAHYEAISQTQVDGRVTAVRPESDYKNTNTTKTHVGLTNVPNYTAETMRAGVTKTHVGVTDSQIDTRANNRVSALRPDSNYKNSNTSWGSDLTGRPSELTDGRIAATIKGANQLAEGVGFDQGNGVYRNATRGLETGVARDGSMISFSTPWDSVPVIKFSAGGLAQSSILAGDQFQEIKAVNVSTSGFTVSAKLKELAGGLAAHTDTGAVSSTLDQELHKSQSAEAFDDSYTFTYNAYVTNDFDPGFGYFSGRIEVGFYTNDGSGWIKRATVTLQGSTSGPTRTYLNLTKTIIVDGLTNHGGTEFGINKEFDSYNNSSIALNKVQYTSAANPATASATPTGTPDLQYFVLGGE